MTLDKWNSTLSIPCFKYAVYVFKFCITARFQDILYVIVGFVVITPCGRLTNFFVEIVSSASKVFQVIHNLRSKCLLLGTACKVYHEKNIFKKIVI